MPARHQGGSVWPFFLLTLLIGSVLYVVPMGRLQTGEQATMRTLLLARDALIGRAVTDPNRPGSLPCPDRFTHLAGNQPNDGIADLLSGNNCPSLVGWLPWATLDLGELRDHHGQRLWYALSPTLRDDDSAQPINSDTPASLTVDGTADIAALLIAPGAALGQQQRPSNDIGDFLEGTNSDGDAHFTHQNSPLLNDLILPLRRSELMATVERRVINDVLHCLQQHARSSGHYPWPVPLQQNNGLAHPGSLFGRLPQRQATSSLSQALAEQTSQLQDASNKLATATTIEQQRAAAQALADRLQISLAFFDQTNLTARQLNQAALQSQQALLAFDNSLSSATSDRNISNAEKSALSSRSQIAQDTSLALLGALEASGIDAFPARLEALQQALRQASAPPDLVALSALTGETQALLSLAHTQNSTLSSQLALALSASRDSAQATLDARNDSKLSETARNLAGQLANALQSLQNGIAGQRQNLPPEEFEGARILLQSAAGQWQFNRRDNTELVLRLTESQALLTRLESGNRSVLERRQEAANSLSGALAAVQTGSENGGAASLNAAERLAELADAMRSNSPNLTLSSLRFLLDSQSQRLAAFQTPGGANAIQADELAKGTASLTILSQLIASHTASLASVSRMPPGSKLTDPLSLHALTASALASLRDNYGTLDRLAQAAANPGNATRQKAAGEAIAATLSKVDALVAANSRNQPSQFAGASAKARLINWQGASCAFLQTSGDSTSWWGANAWEQVIFFQISSNASTSPGRLQINGQGTFPIVIMASGGALAGQARPGMRSADYFEDGNADPGRNGEATNPPLSLIRQALSSRFNDQLAY